MMICKACGGDTCVMDSRADNVGVWRRRRCLSCGNRFSTREVVEDNGRRPITVISPKRKPRVKVLHDY